MRNYSDKESSVRVDFFKPTGKWGYTEAVDMKDVYDAEDMKSAVKAAVIKHLNGRLKGTIAVVLDPYHPYSHPVMFEVPK